FGLRYGGFVQLHSYTTRPATAFEGEWQANESPDSVTARRATRNPCRRRPTVRRSRPKGPEEWYQPSDYHRRGQVCCRRREKGRNLSSDSSSNRLSQPRRWIFSWFHLRTGRQQRRSYADR